MQQRYQYTTVDTILTKFLRDFRGLGFNEVDTIEWIGEALGHMKVASASQEAVAFLEVKDYQVPLPNGLHYIIQVAKNNRWHKEEKASCTVEYIMSEIESAGGDSGCGPCNKNWIPADCNGNPIELEESPGYKSYFDLQYPYLQWLSHSQSGRTWSPVRLANHTFFNSLVCNADAGIYEGTEGGEYTIVEDQIRFNFKEGYVALAYLRQKIDEATGYPMIPDDESAKAAINYYLVWKVKEREAYNHREGSFQLAQHAEQRWLKYVKQFKNKSKMPWGLDEYQNLSEQSKYVLPNHNRYYGFFGKLGRSEDRGFNNPAGSARHLIGNSGYNN
jgi:hypothetical protein